MRTGSKFLAGVLTAALTLCTGMTSFAAGAPDYEDMSSITVEKVYQLENDGTVSPAENFTLIQKGKGTVTDGEAESAPDLRIITEAAFAKGAANVEGTATAVFTITLPEYERVGIYEYTLEETRGTTAGVTYRTDPIRLVVTVINDGDKTRVAAVHTETEGDDKVDSFTNLYSAGELTVAKTVGGNLGDKGKYFEFHITLNAPEGKTVSSDMRVSGGSYAENPEAVALEEEMTFWLKDGETLHFTNLPYGVTYVVEEDVEEIAADGYTTKLSEGSAAAAGEITSVLTAVSYHNEKEGIVDMGISLDSLPYLLILAGVVCAAAVMIVRKRRLRK
ncbi:MAG: FctA domain-containing protein [Eubacteriales bacterium]|nr:FctA domain-containing protein [Eubacteriales bacterium]